MPTLSLQHRVERVTVPTEQPILDEDAGRVKYVWQTGDTDTAGTFQGEFEVTYTSGEIETFPNDGYIGIEVLDDIG